MASWIINLFEKTSSTTKDTYLIPWSAIANKPDIPSEVTESTVAGWGFTKNTGTITGITMNGASKGTSGVVDLGTVLTNASAFATSAQGTKADNAMPKSGGTFTGEVKFGSTENFQGYYIKRMIGSLAAGTRYADLDSSYKDGTWHRMWRLRFPSGSNFWGKIKITLYGGYSSFNASGVMSKSITCNFNTSNIYNNVGCYDGLGVNVEQDFRISEAIWNDTVSAWEVLIWQKNLRGNNSPVIMLECWTANNTNYINAFNGIAAQPVELTQSTSYSAQKASPTGGTKTVEWTTLPVYENPLGEEIATVAMLEDKQDKITSSNKLSSSLVDGLATVATSGSYNDLADKPSIPDISGKLSKTENTGVNVLGTTKSTTTLGGNQLVAPNGIIFAGTAANAGLVTRGICGVSTPDSKGACSKENLYINYDGNNDFNAGRQVVLNAGAVGNHLGSNMYQYAVPRGDIVKAWVEAQGYAKTTQIPTVNNGTLTIQKNGTDVATFTANQKDGTTANITVPTKASDVNALSLDGGTINKSKTIKMDASANSDGANLKWGTVNSKNPYIGYASDQVDGTFVVGSLLGTNYASGLAIGGGSGNLLWKGTKVATINDIPTVNNGTLTIQKNGTNVQTFTANQSGNVTANITVPTKVSELTNDSGFITGISTLTITSNGSVLGTFNGKSGVTIDIPVSSSASATYGDIY